MSNLKKKLQDATVTEHMVPVTIRMPECLHEELKEAVAAVGLSMNEVVVIAVEEVIEQLRDLNQKK